MALKQALNSKKGEGNRKLHKAKVAKNDEFYTQLSDIEKELIHYHEYFKGKTVYCNCDDPFESNFFKYFALNFNHLGLKKLIATCYDGSPVANTELSLFDFETQENKTTRKPHKIVITEVTDNNSDGAFDLSDIKILLANKKNALTRLKGNGDFRSEECIELLKEADIVCTNPPFSLFREYIAQLIEYDKKFIVIGGKSSVGCKEIFPLIEENKLWLGYNQKVKKFRVPDYYEGKLITVKENGIKYAENIGNICWFTNLEHKKRFEEMILYRNYSPETYPKYDNYNAIEVSKVADIPCDYDGVMGVPITFLEKHNPNQFEILGSTQRGCHNKVPDTKKYNDYWEVRQNGEKTGSSGVKTNENPVLVKNDKRKNYFINKDGHIVQSEFTRIFIRRKK